MASDQNATCNVRCTRTKPQLRGELRQGRALSGRRAALADNRAPCMVRAACRLPVGVRRRTGRRSAAPRRRGKRGTRRSAPCAARPRASHATTRRSHCSAKSSEPHRSNAQKLNATPRKRNAAHAGACEARGRVRARVWRSGWGCVRKRVWLSALEGLGKGRGGVRVCVWLCDRAGKVGCVIEAGEPADAEAL